KVSRSWNSSAEHDEHGADERENAGQRHDATARERLRLVSQFDEVRPRFDHHTEEVAVDPDGTHRMTVDGCGPAFVETLGYRKQLPSRRVGLHRQMTWTIDEHAGSAGRSLERWRRRFDERRALEI